MLEGVISMRFYIVILASTSSQSEFSVLFCSCFQPSHTLYFPLKQREWEMSLSLMRRKKFESMGGPSFFLLLFFKNGFFYPFCSVPNIHCWFLGFGHCSSTLISHIFLLVKLKNTHMSLTLKIIASYHLVQYHMFGMKPLTCAHVKFSMKKHFF